MTRLRFVTIRNKQYQADVMQLFWEHCPNGEDLELLRQTEQLMAAMGYGGMVLRQLPHGSLMLIDYCRDLFEDVTE